MLKIGGIINIIIGISHIIGLFWAKQMFEVTGISKEMTKHAQSHFLLPYVLTFFASIVFFTFGLYGLSASNTYKKLPFLKSAIFLIAGIYIFRGVGELIFDISKQETSHFLETTYSLFAIGIGLLYLFGGLKKWLRT